MSRDHGVLEAIAEIARDDDPLADPRWEALSAGTLSDEDRQDLRALAERSEIARDAYEAFCPLDAAAIDRMTDEVFARLSASKERPRAPTRRWAQLIAAMAVTAAIVPVALFALRGRDLGPRPVPRYELSASGGEQPLRGDVGAPADVVRLGPGTRLDVLLRPAVSVDGPVAVRALVLPGDGEMGQARDWDPRVRTSPEGAARIELTRADLADVRAGPCAILFAVGREEALPRDASGLLDLDGRPESDGDPVRVVRLELLLHDGSPTPSAPP